MNDNRESNAEQQIAQYAEPKKKETTKLHKLQDQKEKQ